MQLTISLPPDTSQDEILHLLALIQEKNLPEMMVKPEEKPADTRAMSAGEYLPLLQIILSSTVAAAGVKGLFDVLKAHIEFKKQALIENNKLLASRMETSKMTVSAKTADGKEFQITLSAFDDSERNKLLDKISSLLQS